MISGKIELKIVEIEVRFAKNKMKFTEIEVHFGRFKIKIAKNGLTIGKSEVWFGIFELSDGRIGFGCCRMEVYSPNHVFIFEPAYFTQKYYVCIQMLADYKQQCL